MQSHKHVVQVEVHAPMEPPKPDVPIKSQVPDEALDQIGYPPTPNDPSQEESGVPETFEQNNKSVVPEPQQLSIVPPQPKPMASKQPVPQVLPMPRPMPLPDTVPKVPDQPVPFQGLVNQDPLT